MLSRYDLTTKQHKRTSLERKETNLYRKSVIANITGILGVCLILKFRLVRML